MILTRFNLATPGRESTLRNQPGWLAGRFELFERYCLPTLAAQTSRDFRWIVYFDEATPEPFRARIEACRRVADFHPYFTPLFPGERWGLSARGVLAAEGRAGALAAVDPARQRRRARRRLRRPGAGGGRRPARPAAARRLQPDQRLVFDGRRAYALAHPSNAFVEPARALGDGAHRLRTSSTCTLPRPGRSLQVGGPAAGCRWCTAATSRTRSAAAGCRRPSSPAASRPSIDLGAPASAAGVAAENLLLAPLRAARDRAAGPGAPAAPARLKTARVARC